MRLLRRTWTPLPVSALVLSSFRGAARRSPPLARTGRATVGVPAWISESGLKRGGVQGGGGGVRELFTGQQLGEGIPLVQAIYDELRTMKDPEAEAKKGADSPVISKVLQMMDKLEPRDLGVSESDFRELSHSLCFPIVAEKAIEITMFVLPRGGKIPLHDHPGMAVLSKIVFGSLDVESYDVEPLTTAAAAAAAGAGTAPAFTAAAAAAISAGVGGKVGSNHRADQTPFLPEAAAKSMTLLRHNDAVAAVVAAAAAAATAVVAGFRGGEGVGKTRRGAVPKRPHTVGVSTPSFLLTPSAGNVHCFRAPVACAVFDVLIPPYNNSRGRKCSYFRVEAPPPLEQQEEDSTRCGGITEKTSLDSEGGGEGHAEGGVDRRRDHNVGGTNGGGETRVILEKIPEPKDLPRWGRYQGPAVTVHHN